jgi:tol-pal system protein YbgF
MDTSSLPPLGARSRLAGLGLAFVVILGATQVAYGQQDQDTVNMRLDRLEQGLNDVQRQLNAGPPAAAPGDTDNSGSAGTAAPATGSQALNTEVRLSNLESQMRDLTGQLEELQFGISQVKNRLDKMQSDDEVRFHALEHPGSPPLAPATPGSDQAGLAPTDQNAPPADAGASPDAQSGGPAPIAAAQGAGDMSQAPSANGVLTPPGGGDAGAPPPDQPPPDQQAAAPVIQLPAGSPESQYGYAFNLVRQNDFAGAESAFKQFLQQNPNDPLAGNAQYWLGETYFARNQFQQAAAIFAQGYVKYPKSEKTPNVLLSLGISLGNLGKKQQACLSFAKLERQFPTMHQSIRDLERAQRKHFGCGGAAAE